MLHLMKVPLACCWCRGVAGHGGSLAGAVHEMLEALLGIYDKQVWRAVCPALHAEAKPQHFMGFEYQCDENDLSNEGKPQSMLA